MPMQLDFLAKLLHRAPPAPAVPPPAPVPDSAAITARGREILRGAGCPQLAEKLTIRWNPRMRSTAGTAYPAKILITLNPRLLSFGEEEVDRTLRHELAHVLAHFRVGRRRIAPHGAEWQAACRDLGLTDERRCHDLPLPRRSQARRHAYACPACGVIISRVRPLKKKMACLACCRQHNRGRYDERFRFVKKA